MSTESFRQWLCVAVAQSVAAAQAPSTRGQYAGAGHIFLMFCMFIEGDNFAMPVSDTVLCLYLLWQSLTVDPKNLKTKLSAIRYLHERLGYVWIPPSERFMVHRCIMGLKRLCLTPVRRKLPITPALLIRMRLCPYIDWSTPVMIVVWGAMLIAFFCFLRKDNFTVDKADAFNTRRHLCRGDVVFGRSDVTFTFRHSKTNQFHARVHRTKAVQIPGHLLDPVRALVNAFKVCPQANAAGPAFAVPTSDGGMAPLTHRLFVETLRYCLSKIGVDPAMFSGHSFRRGGATFAHRMGVSPLLIKLMGDWSSDAYMTYIDHATPEDLARLPRALAKAIAALV
jgi:hypothetical protein